MIIIVGGEKNPQTIKYSRTVIKNKTVTVIAQLSEPVGLWVVFILNSLCASGQLSCMYYVGSKMRRVEC